jgi:hypothetical protein
VTDPDEMCKVGHELNAEKPCEYFQTYVIKYCERALKLLSQMSLEVSIIYTHILYVN